MDLRSLKYFIAVYEGQSFSAAAKQCFIAQPSISAAIAQLEAMLNVILFSRHARGIKPTPAGEKLYPLAKKLLGQASAITATFNESVNHPEFKLGVTKGLGVKRMSALLKDFTSKAPSMALTLVNPDATCDARIVTKEELLSGETALALWQEKYLLAMPYDHPLSLNSTVALADFEQLAMIKRSPCNAWQQLEEVLVQAGITLDIRAQIQTIDYALGLVSAGVGCAILPAYNEVLSHKDIVFRPIERLSLSREIVLAYTKESPLLSTLIKVSGNHLQG
ncbi:LysR family transcriptional regulator [Colwellia sp. MEBiC06753]